MNLSNYRSNFPSLAIMSYSNRRYLLMFHNQNIYWKLKLYGQTCIEIIVVIKPLASLNKDFFSATSLKHKKTINHAVWGCYSAHTNINQNERINTDIKN